MDETGGTICRWPGCFDEAWRRGYCAWHERVALPLFEILLAEVDGVA
jgi:hypothetical protein